MQAFRRRGRFCGAARLAFALGVWAPSPEAWASLHSHNDYEQKAPLELALKNRFESVEADVWLAGDDLQVGHIPFVYKGSLEDLYLYPLLFRVMRNQGSVHGDRKTFYLWIDFKDSDPAAAELLRLQLSKFPIFTEFGDGWVKWNAVTVILTGNEKLKRRLTEGRGRRFFTRDSELISSLDPSADPESANRWLWYALDWKHHFSWNGRGAFPTSEQARLRVLLEDAHALGRRVRFYNAPDRRSFWSLARWEGVDLIGTDRVEELARYWANPSMRWKKPGKSSHIQ